MANFIINRAEYHALRQMAKAVFDAAFAAAPCCNHEICGKAVEFQSKLFLLDWDNLVSPDNRDINEDELPPWELDIRMQLKAALMYYQFMGPEAICG